LKARIFLVVGARPHILILVFDEVRLLYFIVRSSEELEVVRLLVGSEVAFLEDVLMGSWLDLGLHVLLPHDVSLLLEGVLALGLGGEPSDPVAVHALQLLLLFQQVLLLKDFFHHLHAD